MNTSEAIDKISAALVLAQKDMLPLIKDSDNPFFKSKYADLHAVTQACYPALQANGICVMQSAESLGTNGINIRTRLIHSSGQFIETECAIPPAGQDPQKYGSAVTYGRRYGLQAAVGLAATDDDAEAAMGRKEPKAGGKSASDSMLDNIIAAFNLQTTIEGLDAKLAKAKGTVYKDDPLMLIAYNQAAQNLNTK